MTGLRHLVLVAVVAACGMITILSVDRNRRPIAQIDRPQEPTEFADSPREPIVPKKPLDEVRETERSRRAERPVGDPEREDGLNYEDSHVGIDGARVSDLCADVPRARRAGGFDKCHLMANSDQEPPLSHQGSHLVILVHQGSDPTQPYPTSVIRDRASRFFHGFSPWGQKRRYPAPQSEWSLCGISLP